MESQYYTPKIEEFHIGFECEKKTMINTSDDDYDRLNYKEVWNKIIIKPFDAPTKTETKEELTWFRVKFLDNDDIQSLGFTYKHSNIPERFSHYMKLEDDMIAKITTYWGMNFNERENLIRIYIGKLHQYPYTEIFRGEVKNKSELKRLLKQLRIIKE